MPEETKEAPKAPSVSENKILAALGYFPLAVLIPLFVILTDKKKDKFLAFHAWQSLILTVLVFVVFVGLGLLSFIPFVGAILAVCGLPVLSLVVAVIYLFLAYKAYLGEKYMIPTLGEYAQKQVK
jgi:uncharacterized membrane protein